MLLPILKPEGNRYRLPSSAQQPPPAAGLAVGERPHCDPKTLADIADTRCILTLPHLENSRAHSSGCRRRLYWGIYQHCLCFHSLKYTPAPLTLFSSHKDSIAFCCVSAGAPRDRPRRHTVRVKDNPAQTAYLPSRQERQQTGRDSRHSTARPGNTGLKRTARSPPVPPETASSTAHLWHAVIQPLESFPPEHSLHQC